MSVQYIISPPKRKESFVHFHKFYLALLYTIRYTGYIGLKTQTLFLLAG